MKIVLLVVLFALISCAFANQVQAQKDMDEIQAGFSKVLLKTILKTQKNSECAASTEKLRKIWIFLPPSIQTKLIEDSIMQIAGQFPRIPYETVEKLVKNFINKEVPPQEACDFAYKIISEEVRRREECVNKCVEEADFTPERLARVVVKCRLDWKCYIREVQEAMQSVAQCIAGCVTKQVQLE
eukprot:gene6898-11060_t